ncbi:hypothetical protein JS541_13810 [Bifidobacterium sp. SO1]|nr:hypothetical protein [Bifidobacterium sp. SO1]
MLTAANFDRHMPVDADMSYEDMLRVLENCPVHVDETVLPENVCGLYDESLRSILIDSNMIEAQKRVTLVHELFHWLHADDCCQWQGRQMAELRAQRETAMMMIPPDRYIRAEREYDGDKFQIACELEVTVRLVEIYREMLEGDARLICRFVE